MRNISFDESTVLNELVKIAHEKNLIKKSEEGFDWGSEGQTPLDIPPTDQKQESMDFGNVGQTPLDVSAVGDLEKAKKVIQSPNFNIETLVGIVSPIINLPGAKELVLEGLTKIKHTIDPNPVMYFTSTKVGRAITKLVGLENLSSLFPEVGYWAKGASVKNSEEKDIVKEAEEEGLDWGGEGQVPLEVNVSNDLEKAKRLLQNPNFNMDTFISVLSPIINLPGARNLVFKGLNKIKHVIGQNPIRYFTATKTGRAIVKMVGPANLAKLFPELSRWSKGASVKIAEEKKYDVTGEKGEDLVNDAHPGGGTRTELDSKTDENLVETIIEQQNKDLEIARSVPKGVLAKLIDLANTLDKKGYTDEANEIDDVLNKLAYGPGYADVPERGNAELIQQMQARRNQALKAATNALIDGVLPRAQMYKGHDGGKLAGALEGLRGQNPNVAYNQMLNYIRQIPDANKSGFMSVLNNTVNSGTYKDIINEAVSMNSAIQQEQLKTQKYNQWVAKRKEVEEKERTRQDTGKEEPKGVATKEKRKGDPVVRKFQENFNKAIMGVPMEELKKVNIPWSKISVDGIRGPQTNKALSIVKKKGGMLSFIKAMMELKQGKAEETKKWTPREVYPEFAEMYNQILRNPERPTRFPSLASEQGQKIRSWMWQTSQGFDGWEGSVDDLKKLLFKHVGQMGRSGPEEVAKAAG